MADVHDYIIVQVPYLGCKRYLARGVPQDFDVADCAYMYLWYSYTYAHFLVSKETTQRDLSFQLKIKSTQSSMQTMEFQNHNLKKICNQKHVIAPPPPPSFSTQLSYHNGGVTFDSRISREELQIILKLIEFFLC